MFFSQYDVILRKCWRDSEQKVATNLPHLLSLELFEKVESIIFAKHLTELR
jgi:hypothetical protein